MVPVYSFSGYDPDRADRDYAKMGLDLAKEIPSLFDKNEEAVQKSFFFTLDIEALDTNVETGPNIGRNKEQFVFKIVSEAELLGEISREETSLGDKLDEVLKKLLEGDPGRTRGREPALAGQRGQRAIALRIAQRDDGRREARTLLGRPHLQGPRQDAAVVPMQEELAGVRHSRLRRHATVLPMVGRERRQSARLRPHRQGTVARDTRQLCQSARAGVLTDGSQRPDLR